MFVGEVCWGCVEEFGGKISYCMATSIVQMDVFLLISILFFTLYEIIIEIIILNA